MAPNAGHIHVSHLVEEESLIMTTTFFEMKTLRKLEKKN